MKNLSISMFIFCAVMIFCGHDVFAQNVGKINSNCANLITAPTLDSAVLKKLSNGQAVEIIDSKNDFYKICVDSIEAYVQKKFVDLINIEGIVNAENVNIRALPYEDAQVISKVNIGDKININATTGDWFVITFNNNKAYISKKFVVCNNADKLQKVEMPSHKFAVVTSDNGINLRKDKSTESAAVCAIPSNGVLDVVDEKITDTTWVKVAFENKTGYVNSNYIQILEDEKPTQTSTKASQIINYAKQFIGTPYKYAGRNLSKGVDCSGFVYCIMKNFGINLNSSSKTQAKNGVEVANKANLLPADLVFFSNYGGKDIQHVGIYIGNGQFIHSASPNNKGVMISSLNESYYVQNYITARRVL
jgi:Cell wall-associated hydrolases (invasion-associated proteins)